MDSTYLKKESKEEKFIRLAERRTETTLKNMSLLANLADKRNYSYSPSQVKRILSIIEDSYKKLKNSFEVQARAEKREKFRL